MIFALPYPVIDPVLIDIGPFAIRWYALAYVLGLFLGWRYIKALVKQSPASLEPKHIDDLLVWATLAVILGGRLGYVLVYKPGYFLANPLEVAAVWRGGMSFHGGLVGVAAALILFARVRRLGLLALADRVACAVPIGLFFGRIANFINGELYGRVSDVPWAMALPMGGPEPRHPSQLYEAALEGLVLFVVMFVLWRTRDLRDRPGLLTGAFLTGYGVFRIVGEVFREPDAHLGFLFDGVTMGQLLSVPMVALGLYLMLRVGPSLGRRA
ncbi:MAG: prolipoprotein diacylglyceryl transferase [Alphaproteobacteria bacterium]